MKKNSNKKIFLSPPHMNGEENAFIKDAMSSNWIAPLGPHVDAFEKEVATYLGVKYAAALSSGTAALHLSLKILGVNQGDYIFCSDLTFIASANAICYLGAIPVFIDSEESSWNMCPKSLDLAFKKHLPKAVLVTDLYGQSADYKLIQNICDKYDVPIIEDAAESLGAQYNKKKCGSFGEMGIISFNGNKIITNSGGGMLLSNNKKYINEAKKLATQSREKAIHYEHAQIGYNYRMSNILAAIGRAQLKSLDNYVKIRRSIFNYYNKHLNNIDGIKLMPEINNGKSSRWLTTLLLKKKSHKQIEDIIKFYLKENIEIRPIWKPMHLQPVFKHCQFYHYSPKPLTVYLFEHGLCLPSGSGLLKNEMDRIINILLKKTN
ncbi:DegT/DnrJ/EryC1/StrS family aminotransferase [Candidatus Marinimicrobia bacterium]|nr:DegT/DnrJ/EryC1/StrS family aminotransferase [Candidatus Neomarinimicrobiota bacterium]